MARVVVLIAVCSLLLPAEEPVISPAFDYFYNLEYGEAIREFKQQCTAHPDDPAPFNYVALAVLYREMFKAGALEIELASGDGAYKRWPKMNPSLEAKRNSIRL